MLGKNIVSGNKFKKTYGNVLKDKHTLNIKKLI
jgi:hypothetical protein